MYVNVVIAICVIGLILWAFIAGIFSPYISLIVHKAKLNNRLNNVRYESKIKKIEEEFNEEISKYE